MRTRAAVMSLAGALGAALVVEACARGGATCGDTGSDPFNCGACGNTCPTGQGCLNGHCTPSPISDSGVKDTSSETGKGGCPSGQTSCAGDAGATCVNTQTDNGHCGNCTTVCYAQIETCSAGACVSTCAAGKVLCIPDGGAGDGGDQAHCADTQNDTTDCGSCFHACLGGETCSLGVCKSNLLGSGTAADPWHTASPPANCSDYHTQFPTATDGVYTTHPAATDIGVYCDMTHGGTTYENFGFGQYSASYSGYTLVGVSDFTGTTQFDAAFAYLYTRNAGLVNINPSGWTDSNCCIENVGGTSFLALAGSSYMYPANGGVVNCGTSYSATTIQLTLETSGTVLTSITQAQAGMATSSTTCTTSGNPGIFVKKY